MTRREFTLRGQWHSPFQIQGQVEENGVTGGYRVAEGHMHHSHFLGTCSERVMAGGRAGEEHKCWSDPFVRDGLSTSPRMNRRGMCFSPKKQGTSSRRENALWGSCEGLVDQAGDLEASEEVTKMDTVSVC